MSSSVETAKPKEVRFLCCTKTVERIKNYKFNNKHRSDAQGFLVCPEHGQRRFGWNTPRQTDFPSVPQNLDLPSQIVKRYNFAETALERDKLIRAELGL